MGQQRHVVAGVDSLVRGVQRRIDIAAVAHRVPGCLAGCLQLLAIAGGVEPGVGPGFPLDLELSAALLGGPGVGRQHRNTTEGVERRRQWTDGNEFYPLDAGYPQCFGSVEVLHRATQGRRALDGSMQHVGHYRVYAVTGLAHGHVGEIDDRHILADVPEVLFLLQPELAGLGNRQARRHPGELTVVCRAAARLVVHAVQTRRALGLVHLPGHGG